VEDDVIEDAWFGYSVAMDGNIAVIGTNDQDCARQSIVIIAVHLE
jgi:hypothetical protein